MVTQTYSKVLIGVGKLQVSIILKISLVGTLLKRLCLPVCEPARSLHRLLLWALRSCMPTNNLSRGANPMAGWSALGGQNQSAYTQRDVDIEDTP